MILVPWGLLLDDAKHLNEEKTHPNTVFPWGCAPLARQGMAG
jgi:hypothetical protein